MSTTSLLSAIYQNAADLPEQLQTSIARGADLDATTEHGESALRVASNNGRFDVVAALLDAGANWYQLGWTNTIQETIFGTHDSIRASVAQHGDLEQRDFWSRTPLLMAIALGDIAKAELLLTLGADATAAGRCGKTAPMYAIERDDVAMLRWLATKGFNMDARDDFQRTPLMEAAAAGKIESIRFLAMQGVDLFATDHIGQRALQIATDIGVCLTLQEFGDELTGLSPESHAALLGVDHDGEPTRDKAAFNRHGARVFGCANPQRTDYPFWIDMIRCGASAWRARDRTGGDDDLRPVWSFQRFGRTTTVLGDGRIVDIGGEHEDYYDPDFCIYNDVTVFDGKGSVAIYSYPSKEFPPIDFHTATLIGNHIYIIGGLGYTDARRPGTTPVFRLDLTSFRISAVNTRGEGPGWIYEHKARRDGTSAIVIHAGTIITAPDSYTSTKNDSVYRLCLQSFSWTRLAP